VGLILCDWTRNLDFVYGVAEMNNSSNPNVPRFYCNWIGSSNELEAGVDKLQGCLIRRGLPSDRTIFDIYIYTEWPKKMYTLVTHQYLWNKFK
jgi:hypothetical protein